MIHNLKPYPAYKESGLPWVGEVPEHWVLRRLDRLFNLRNEPPLEGDPRVTGYLDGRVTLRSNVSGQKIKGVVKEAGWQRVHPGDFAVSGMNAHLGGMGVSDSLGKCSPIYLVLQPKKNTNAHFISHAVRLAAHRGALKALINTIRFNSADFKRDDLKSICVYLPSLLEQSAIVRFFYHVDLRIRRYIRAKKKLIDLLNEQRQAIIHRAVICGLDPSVRLKSAGVEWLGDVPEHWQVMPLRRVTISRCDGPFGSGLKSSHYTDHGIRVVRLQNIGHAEFKNSDAAFISPAHYSTLGDHSVEAGDVLVAGLGDERHPAGRACVAPASIVPAIVKADCFRFRLDRVRLNPEFLALHLTATAVEASALLSTGATRQRTNLQATAARPIAVPPLEEQVSIVDYITRETRCLRAAVSSAELAIILLDEYRTRLLADVVTGKVDVREVAARLPDAIEGTEFLNENDALAGNDEDCDGAEFDVASEESVA